MKQYQSDQLEHSTDKLPLHNSCGTRLEFR